MSKKENKKVYFDLLKNTDKNTSLTELIKKMEEGLTSKSLEFSLCTKLLHTKDEQLPIYDRKIREYLANQENVDFWWNHAALNHKDAKGKKDIEKIEHDWNELKSWYNTFLGSSRGKEWVEWFDTTFKEHKTISNTKKIDFIIFACIE